MTDTSKTGGAAYPVPYSERTFLNQGGAPYQMGLTKREAYAMAAMQGLLSNHYAVKLLVSKQNDINEIGRSLSETAFAYVDDMIKASER